MDFRQCGQFLGRTSSNLHGERGQAALDACGVERQSCTIKSGSNLAHEHMHCHIVSHIPTCCNSQLWAENNLLNNDPRVVTR
eukprot:5121830-Amphidinium_carterae.1